MRTEEKNEARSLVGVNALCFLQCFDTVDWLTGRAFGGRKVNLSHLFQKSFFQNSWRKKTEREIANHNSTEKWPSKLRWCVITGSIACSATRRYLSYSEANFEVFRPAGATCCTDWGEIWHGGVSVPNFTPIGATIRV